MAWLKPRPTLNPFRVARRLCRGLANRSLDCLRQLHGHKVLLGVQVVFARLIDDANLMMRQGRFVWDYLINLAQLKGGSVASVAYADDELCFAFHVSQIS
jgi:hypothetical protein